MAEVEADKKGKKGKKLSFKERREAAAEKYAGGTKGIHRSSHRTPSEKRADAEFQALMDAPLGQDVPSPWGERGGVEEQRARKFVESSDELAPGEFTKKERGFQEEAAEKGKKGDLWQEGELEHEDEIRAGLHDQRIDRTLEAIDADKAARADEYEQYAGGRDAMREGGIGDEDRRKALQGVAEGLAGDQQDRREGEIADADRANAALFQRLTGVYEQKMTPTPPGFQGKRGMAALSKGTYGAQDPYEYRRNQDGTYTVVGVDINRVPEARRESAQAAINYVISEGSPEFNELEARFGASGAAAGGAGGAGGAPEVREVLRDDVSGTPEVPAPTGEKRGLTRDAAQLPGGEPTGDRIPVADQGITHPPLVEPEYRGHLGLRRDDGTSYADIIGSGQDAEGVRYVDIVKPDGGMSRVFEGEAGDEIGHLLDRYPDARVAPGDPTYGGGPQEQLDRFKAFFGLDSERPPTRSEQLSAQDVRRSRIRQLILKHGWAGLSPEVKEDIIGEYRGGFDPTR